MFYSIPNIQTDKQNDTYKDVYKTKLHNYLADVSYVT